MSRGDEAAEEMVVTIVNLRTRERDGGATEMNQR